VIKYFFDISSGCICGKILSDEDYLNILTNRIGDFDRKQVAYTKLSIDESMVNEVAPVKLEGFSVEDAYLKSINSSNLKLQNESTKWIAQQAKTFVTSTYQISWLFFGNEQIYIYRYEYIADEGFANENTQEYFYKDVTSFSIVSENINDRAKKTNLAVETFRIIVPGDKFTCAFDDTPENQASIKGMQQLLRNRKGR
jgi:hypothetical protein